MEAIELLGPTGPLVLEFPGDNERRPAAALVDGLLTVQFSSSTAGDPFQFELGLFTVRRSDHDRPPHGDRTVAASSDALAPLSQSLPPAGELPPSPRPRTYSLTWNRPGSVPGEIWSLVFFRGQRDVEGAWRLSARQTCGGDGESVVETLIDVAVLASPAGLGRFLFQSPEPRGTPRQSRGDFRAERAPIGQGSWFARVQGKHDQVLAGAVYSDPQTLETLSADIALALSPLGQSGSVTAQLHFASPYPADLWTGAPGAMPPALFRIRLSGEMTLSNRITFRRGEVDCPHFARVVFDGAELAAAALFSGQGPVTPQVTAMAVEHRFAIEDHTLSWSVAQPVRFARAAWYDRVILGNSAASDTRLVLDAGWVFWLGDRERPPVSGTGGVEVESLHLGRLWRLAARDPVDFATNDAYVVRLPFLFDGPESPLNPPPIELAMASEETTRLVPLGGAQPPTIRLRAAPIDPIDDSQPRLIRHGPNAAYLSSSALRLLFAEIDADFLPGFRQPNSTPGRAIITNVLPEQLGDFQWVAGPSGPRELPAAALATPYVPLGLPVPFDRPALVDYPFSVSAAEPIADDPEATHVDAQLLGFVRGSLRRIRASASSCGRRGWRRTKSNRAPRTWCCAGHASSSTPRGAMRGAGAARLRAHRLRPPAIRRIAGGAPELAQLGDRPGACAVSVT